MDEGAEIQNYLAEKTCVDCLLPSAPALQLTPPIPDCSGTSGQRTVPNIFIRGQVRRLDLQSSMYFQPLLTFALPE